MARILLVDDQKSMRNLIREILRDAGLADIDEAEDGAGALARMEKARYDVVISDWNMPRMDGISFLKAVRANESMKTVPVIMLTGQSAREQVLEAKRHGVSGFIRKPFEPDDVISAVRRFIPASPPPAR